MVCNLAVAITKAALSDERLKSLLDTHMDEVQQIMEKYLHRQYPTATVTAGQPGAGLLRVNDLMLQIKQGEVTILGTRRNEQLAETLSEQASTFLKVVADQLFTREVERALTAVAMVTGKQTSDVENAGTVQRATVYAIHANGLKARVFVLPSARLQIFIDSGTFEQAKATTLQLVRALQTQNLAIQVVGDVEQHRADVEHVHVRQAQQKGQ